MIVLPAIDLSDGACVRLQRGEFSAKTEYAESPYDVARRYESEGASWLHVVDLDGARDGSAAQSDAVLELAGASRLDVQVGGGIRTASQIETFLDGGIARVIVGSTAVNAPDETRSWLATFGPERIVLAFDVRIRRGVPMPATRGWQDEGASSLWDVLARYDGAALRHVLCTDIERDGMLGGPNVSLYEDIQRHAPALALQASGGVSALADLRALRRAGLGGAVVGKALYENRFRLSEALAC